MTELTMVGRVPVDRSVQAVADRLAEAREKVDYHERLLRGARRSRDLLVLKLTTAGLPERTVSEVAGVTNARVHQLKAAGIEGWRERYGVEDEFRCICSSHRHEDCTERCACAGGKGRDA